MSWTFETAKSVAQIAEIAASSVGAHVALTGGVLYKEGERKDLDLLFYPDGCVNNIDRNEIIHALKKENFEIVSEGLEGGRIVKAEFDGGKIDLFFPTYEDQFCEDTKTEVSDDYRARGRRVHTVEDLQMVEIKNVA